jgi:hypothetical protein
VADELSDFIVFVMRIIMIFKANICQGRVIFPMATSRQWGSVLAGTTA